MQDYPMLSGFHIVIMRFLGLFGLNFGAVMNIFYLATFPLTAGFSMFTMRKMGISGIAATLAGILYSILPYHFLRYGHYFLATYYILPLMILVIYWVYSGRNFWSGARSKFIFSILICLIMGFSGSYYAFFGGGLLVAAGLAAWSMRRDIRYLSTAVVLCLIIVASLVVDMSPSLLYFHNEGRNMAVAGRNPIESEIYGLKIAQMLLPVTNHRIETLRSLKEFYNNTAPLVNENGMASLGLIGSLGFIALIMILLFHRRNSNDYMGSDLVSFLSKLNLICVLFATIGGFNVLFNLYITSQYRGYNRISVYIAFFCFACVALLFDRWTQKLPKGAVYLLAGILLAVGVFDQTTASFIPPYKSLKSEFYNDERFVAKIESAVPAGSEIFQLPYVPFPENPPVNKMIDYDLFKGYVHSKMLRWSYGAIKGRAGDAWQQWISQLPVEEQISILHQMGFAGIYIDRFGYTDSAAQIENDFRRVLHTRPIISDNKRLAFYKIPRQVKLISVSPLFCYWGPGFYQEENNGSETYRWSDRDSHLEIYNWTAKRQNVELSMSIASAYGEFSMMHIKSDTFNDYFNVNANGYAFHRNISLLPNEHISINFTSEAQKVDAPGDPREMYFQLRDFKLIAH